MTTQDKVRMYHDLLVCEYTRTINNMKAGLPGDGGATQCAIMEQAQIDLGPEFPFFELHLETVDQLPN